MEISERAMRWCIGIGAALSLMIAAGFYETAGDLAGMEGDIIAVWICRVIGAAFAVIGVWLARAEATL